MSQKSRLLRSVNGILDLGRKTGGGIRLYGNLVDEINDVRP